MKNKKTWDLISIATIPIVMTLGNAMIIPVLPTIQRELDITALQVSMIITVYSVVAIVLIPIAGFLSDKYGRKKIIVPSLIIAGLGGLISGWASWQLDNPFALIIFGRFIQGIGAAGAFPIVLPLVGDLFKNEAEVSKGLGIIETSNTFGKLLSPVIGAMLAAIIWYLPFFVFSVFTLIPIALVLFYLKTPKNNENKVAFRTFLKLIKEIFHREGRWLYAIFFIGCVGMFVVFGLLFYLSAMLEDQHNIFGITKGLILAIPLVGLCLASYFTGKVIKQEKQRMKWLTFGGLLLLTVTSFAASFTLDIYLLLTAFFLFGIGIGIVLPSIDALVIEGIEKEERGTITSIYSSMRFIGIAIGPPIIAILMKISHDILFFFIAGVSLAAVIVALLAIKPDNIKKG